MNRKKMQHLLDDRKERQDKISDLQCEVHDIQDAIKRELIDARATIFLKVDYTGLQRAVKR